MARPEGAFEFSKCFGKVLNVTFAPCVLICKGKAGLLWVRKYCNFMWLAIYFIGGMVIFIVSCVLLIQGSMETTEGMLECLLGILLFVVSLAPIICCSCGGCCTLYPIITNDATSVIPSNIGIIVGSAWGTCYLIIPIIITIFFIILNGPLWIIAMIGIVLLALFQICFGIRSCLEIIGLNNKLEKIELKPILQKIIIKVIINRIDQFPLL